MSNKNQREKRTSKDIMLFYS